MRRALAALAGAAALAVAAPLLAPHDPDEIVDVAAARLLPPGASLALFTRLDGSRIGVTAWQRTENRILYERAGRAGSIAVEELRQPEPRYRRFLLGTDGFGRDLLSRILHGARVSLGIALLAVAIGVGLGALAGAASGYVGGIADAGVMRLVDVLHSVPRFFLFLIFAAAFGPSFLLLALVLGGTGWTGIARITRGQVLSLKGRGFVEAARALGGGTGTIVLRHLLPQCAGPIAVTATLMGADTILAETSLSFIGLGVQPPASSWGNIIAAGREVLLPAWWLSAFPGLAIVASVLLLHRAGRSLAAQRGGPA